VILDRFNAAGVDDRLITVVPGVPTGTAHVAYNSDGSRAFVFNIAHSAAGHLPEVAVATQGFLDAGVTVLHISGSTLGDPAMRRAALDLCQRLDAAGTAISIDPNIRAELMRDGGYLDTVRQIVAMAAYVLPSDADADLLWPGQPFDDWSAALIRDGARAVVLKRGDQGCIGRAGDETLSLPAHPVTVVDPTGAGDCFCATFVALHSTGHPLAFALTRANAAGALAVQSLGPMEGNSTLPRIEAFLTSQPS
jgi:sugar/nucleoside kinase (ribokinase family)